MSQPPEFKQAASPRSTTVDFWNNPLVIHAFESPAGRRKLWWLVLGQPVGLLGLYAVLVQWWARELTGQVCLVALIGLEVVGGMLGALVLTGAAVNSDVKQRTLESLKLTSLTPAQLLLGKLLAEPAALYLSVWATMPLAAVCGVAAGFPLVWVFLAYANISALMLLAGCLGLAQPLESRSARPGALSPAHAIMAIVMFIGVESSIGGYVALIQTRAWQADLEIFGVPVPVMVLIPLASLLLAGVFFRGAVRRLTQPVLPPLGKPTAYGILAAADVLTGGILFGIQFPPFGLGLGRRLAIFWLVHVGLSLFLLLAATGNRQAVSSWVWRFRGRLGWHRDHWLSDRSPNDLLAATLAIMGVVDGLLFISLPVMSQNAWQMTPTEAAINGAALISQALVILCYGAMIQWLVFQAREALGLIIFLSIVLFAFPYVVVVAPLMFQRPPNPAWLAAASPVYHIEHWFRETATDAREILLLLSVYAVLWVSCEWRFHVQLRRLIGGVDRTLERMGYSPAASLADKDQALRARSSAGS